MKNDKIIKLNISNIMEFMKPSDIIDKYEIINFIGKGATSKYIKKWKNYYTLFDNFNILKT